MSSHASLMTQLEPPGAGLPAFELAWLRVAFRSGCAIMPINAGLRWFKLEERTITSLVRRVSVSQGSAPILIDRIVGIEDSSRCWSVFMVLDHLRIVNDAIAHIVDVLSNNQTLTQEVRIQDVKPNPMSGPEVIQEFIQSVASYESRVRKLGILGNDQRHPHPWFGPMTAFDWHCLAAIHQWVHRRQLERIVRVTEARQPR